MSNQKQALLRSANKNKEYQPSGAGGTRSPPAMPYRLLNPKWLTGGPKLLLNKFFDPSTPSMRNIVPAAKSKMAARGPQNG